MRRILSSAAIVVVAAASVLPVQAAETELALLSSYIGNWRGEGVVRGGDSPDPFRCRLTISKGNANRINYAGRCSLVNANLSISGTINFNDQTRRYEAAMSSNAGFTGMAIGRISGQNITFDLQEQQKDRAGSDVRIGSQITLSSGQITVAFEIEFNDSGEVLTSSVPFSR